MNLDSLDEGSIKAYQVSEGNGEYKVEIVSDKTIAVNETSFEGIFKHFKKLKSVNFGNIVLDKAKSLKVMFSGCSSLTAVNFSSSASTGFNTSNVVNYS